MTIAKGEKPAEDWLARVLEGYRPANPASDELLDPAGGIRQVWRSFIDHLSKLSPDDLAQHMERGDRYLRDAGVFYHKYGPDGAAERDWPLSHLPVLIADSEWSVIADGLIQRANLLEAVVADLYGENRLVADGHLPAALVAGNPEWLRPLVGVRPRSGKYLHFLAFEIGRGPDGNWWVLGDRAQAPSGAGFALENRVATSRVFADVYDQTNVHRLAGFFRGFRDALLALRGDPDERVAILSPGQHTDTYFEHAYIARYLGLSLLEGGDLVVRNDKVLVRTVSGLQPVGVLWRRLDAAWADPLELREGSEIGTPGLVGAVRGGGVEMVNALGAGVVESRVLLAFLPKIAEVLLDAPLKLPNVATWWCGQPAERSYVLENRERMLIGEALSTRLPFEPDDRMAIAGQIRGAGDESIADWIAENGDQFVGQEAVTLSTSPAVVDGKLVPRPMSLRVFLARTEDGWQVMPGGYARIGSTDDPTAIAMQQGGSVGDVWIVGDNAVPAETLLSTAGETFSRSRSGTLPSRAADNLFWLGRYVERTEFMVRLLRAHHARLAESGGTLTPLQGLLAEFLASNDAVPEKPVPDGLRATLAAAVSSAGRVRDRFSVDGWAALNDLSHSVAALADTVRPGDDAARAYGVFLRKLNGFSGLVHDNMYRFTGWRFLSIGRSIERASTMTAVLAAFADPAAPDGGLDLAVEIGDSVMTHRRRYSVATNRATVIDLLALDLLNPRSVFFHLSEVQDHIGFLPNAVIDGQRSPLSRTMLQTYTMLGVCTPDTLDTETLNALSRQIFALSERLAADYLA